MARMALIVMLVMLCIGSTTSYRSGTLFLKPISSVWSHSGQTSSCTKQALQWCVVPRTSILSGFVEMRKTRPCGIKSGIGGLTMAVAKDYYKLLGVDRKADTQEIRRAYKRLALKNHPDINKDPGAKDKFIEINEAYAVLTDPDKRRLYDLGSSNPFSSTSWGSSSSSSSTGRRGASYGRTTSSSSGTGFDFDEYWKQYRGKEERRQDIDDSFSKIFEDLFTGVKKVAKSKSRSSDSLLDNFGDFLETMLGVDDLGSSGSSELDDLAGDEDAMRMEISDAEFVVQQLQQRVTRLKEDAAKTEAMAEEWGRKVDRAAADEKEAFSNKQKVLEKSAARLRERSRQVEGMVKSQGERLKRIRDLLEAKRKGTSSSRSTGGSTSSSSSSSSSTGGARSASGGASATAPEKIVVSCTQCAQKVRVPAGVSGTINCPACGTKFRTDGGGKTAGANTGGATGQSTSTSSGTSASSASSTQEKIVIGCPACEQKLRVKAGQAGTVKCPGCSTSFSVQENGEVVQGWSRASSPSDGSTTGGVGSNRRTNIRDSIVEDDSWQEQFKMREELRKAKVDEELSKLKKDLGM